MPLLTLLRALAGEQSDLSFAALTMRDVEWAIEAGVGPLLFSVLKNHPEEGAPSPLRSLLQGADLTAQVLTGELLDAVDEILRHCSASVGDGVITLLKGASLGQQCYPELHLRTMRDIDIFVDNSLLPKIEALLKELGYHQTSDYPPEYYLTHHHTMPFVHPSTGIWVEVHRGLVYPRSLVGQDKVFSIDNVKNELRPAEFRGKSVTRLSDELQIVYLVAHWAYSLTVVGGIIALCDIVLLLKHTQTTLRWERVLSWLGRSAATSYLYLMLTYLRRYELIEAPVEVFQELHRRQPTFNALTLRIVHLLIDHYLIAGKPCGAVLSPARLHILWDTLLTPDSPTHNLLRVPWNFLAPHLYRLGQRGTQAAD